MAGLCERLAQWVQSPFSAVARFQKRFVDDVADTVRRQREQSNKRSRERQERAVQLHLDKLEGKYLCCVCGCPGESREQDDVVYDTFSIVTLPERRVIERGLSRALRAGEAGGGGGGHEDRYRESSTADINAGRHRRIPSLSSRGGPPHGGNDGEEEEVEVRRSSNSFVASRGGISVVPHSAEDRGKGASPRHDQRSSVGSTERRNVVGEGGIDNDNNDNNDDDDDDDGAREYPSLNPDLVPPLEVRGMMHKIQHAVLNREARAKRKAVHVHRDRGLTKIEESEVDLYSSFFQRPVHGYLCRACYTSARRRLDTVTEQIQTLLFKATHPFLRKVSEEELKALSSAGQLSTGLASLILDLRRRWNRQQESTARRASRRQQRREQAGKERGKTGAAPTSAGGFKATDDVTSSETASEEEGEEGEEGAEGVLPPGGGHSVSTAKATLPDAVITGLRTTVRCAVCQRRQSCFFRRMNVLFLCQFCTARDRVYREQTVCLNDEPLPVETVHLLTELAKYYEGVHQAQELRQLPQTELRTAPTSLFHAEESLFSIQSASLRRPPQPPAAPSASPLADETRGPLPRQTAAAEGGGERSRKRPPPEDAVATREGEEPLAPKVEPRPYIDVAEAEHRKTDARAVVGATQLSLFESTRIQPVAAPPHLFEEEVRSAPRVDNRANALAELFGDGQASSTAVAEPPAPRVVDPPLLAQPLLPRPSSVGFDRTAGGALPTLPPALSRVGAQTGGLAADPLPYQPQRTPPRALLQDPPYGPAPIPPTDAGDSGQQGIGRSPPSFLFRSALVERVEKPSSGEGSTLDAPRGSHEWL